MDYQLSRTIWKVLGVTSEEGRLAVASPREYEKLENIRDLLFLHKVMMDEKKYNELYKRIREIASLRDILGHGIWTKHDDGWKVIKSKSTVVDQSIHKIARRRQIRPESVLVTSSGLADTIQAIDDVSDALDSLHEHVPSPRKTPEPLGSEHHEVRFHKLAKQKPLPRSSLE